MIILTFFIYIGLSHPKTSFIWYLIILVVEICFTICRFFFLFFKDNYLFSLSLSFSFSLLFYSLLFLFFFLSPFSFSFLIQFLTNIPGPQNRILKKHSPIFRSPSPPRIRPPPRLWYHLQRYEARKHPS